MRREEKHKRHCRNVSSQIHARNSHLIQYCYDFLFNVISEIFYVTFIIESVTLITGTQQKIPSKTREQGVCDGTFLQSGSNSNLRLLPWIMWKY